MHLIQKNNLNIFKNSKKGNKVPFKGIKYHNRKFDVTIKMRKIVVAMVGSVICENNKRMWGASRYERACKVVQ